MQQSKYLMLATLLTLLVNSTLLYAQENGGPYTTDENTILLMHFDGNLNEEALNHSVNNVGIAKSYSTSPITGLRDAIYFDNSLSTNNSYITIPYSSELSMTTNWTIEFWFCINSWDQSHNLWPIPIVLPAPNWETNYFLEIPASQGKLIFNFHTSNGMISITSSQNSIKTGTWYHVALINDNDNNTAKLILRNTDFQTLEEQSESYPAGTIISTGTDDLRIGAGFGGENYFNGYMDELRISDIVRDYSVTYEYDWQTTSSDYFLFHYTNTGLLTDNLISVLENKFDDLDYTILEIWDNINLLDRTQKVNVYLYDTDQPFASAPVDIRDWDIGYYIRGENELHIKVPSTVRQLKYFANFEKAAISVLARYVMAKKRTDGNEPSKGLSFGYGLYESGYSPDINLIQNYLDANNNTFPNNSAFNTWPELDEKINVELAYTYVFASIFRFGYLMPTIYDGLYNSQKEIWYQIVRIFFLTDLANGGMQKFYEGDDFIVYTNDQDVADLIVDGLIWYADQFEESFGARINHPLLVTIYGSAETYTYTRRGNNNEVENGGEALSHSLLRAGPMVENIDTELNKLLTKYAQGHEFMHNTFASLAVTEPPIWLNEGSAMFAGVDNLQGYNGITVNNFENYHDYFWNDNGMYFPDLPDIFQMNGGFGYGMGFSSFAFIKDNFSKEALLQFMKRGDDFSIIGYTNIDQFQRHLYEYLYNQYMPDFLFNPNWDLETNFTPSTNFTFNWDGHYIKNLVLEYSSDGMTSWNQIAEVSFDAGSYTWVIPNSANCVLRFSDKDFPDIYFTYQILGDKPKFDKVMQMTFENSAANLIQNNMKGRVKGEVSFIARGGENGDYAEFDGVWDVVSVQNYPNLSLENDWTIQGDFMIDNTTGIMNQKPVLLEKLSTNMWNKNYLILFNDNGLNNLLFEYKLENGNTVRLEVDNAGITDGNWYTFYFTRSTENNIAEARVYDQFGNMLGSEIRQLNGEGPVLTGSGDLYLGSSAFGFEKCLQGGLDNIIISDTYHDALMSNAANNAPVVNDIPDQIIEEGGNFAIINLDDFVIDFESTSSEISWSSGSNSELSVAIDGNRVATVTIPNAEWNGSEIITFTATDPEGVSGSDDAIFTVTGVNDAPVVNDIQDQTIDEGGSLAAINLDNFVTDIDNEDEEITWSFIGNDKLSIEVNANRVATVTIPNAEWNGSETITFTATDPEGASGSDDVVFTVTNVNDGPIVSNIANQTIDEGGNFTTIQLDNYVTDIDNEDSEISWSFSGNDALSIEVDANRVATILTPNGDWFGNETISFTAKDPGNVSDSKDVKFTVNNVNDPPVISGVPELIEFVSDTSFTIDIFEFISDVETAIDSLLCEFSINSDSILFSYDDGTGVLTLSAELQFGGEGDLIWSVNDSEAIVKDTIQIEVEKAIIIGVDDKIIIPDEYVLHQNYPNPFNPTTMIKYGLPEQSNIKLEIFNMLGQSVGLLINDNKSAGYYETTWDASYLPSGLYLVSLRAEGLNTKKSFVQVKKALLLK